MKPPRVVGMIQARMSSVRLPGKNLLPVLGRPLLAYLLERVRPSRTVDHWVVATSEESTDDPIVEVCGANGVDCFRGSLTDVLDRYRRCATHCQADVIVRLTADCPLQHWEVVDSAVRIFQETGVDFFTNSFPPTLEDGFDVEVFERATLERAWVEARTPEEREHVTPWIRGQGQLRREFRKFWPGYDYQLSVNLLEDFKVVSRIIELLTPRDPLFTMRDVVELVEANPSWDVARIRSVAGVG